MGHLAVIGLGAMGRAIARNLVEAGHDVVVWNRSPGPVAALEALGATPAATLADALATPVVLSVLSDDAAVADLFLDSGALASATPGAIHANLATVSPELAARAARAHRDHGLEYVSAPVFGRVPVAEAGALTVMAAGSRTALTALEPYFAVIGNRTWRMGDDPAVANVSKILGNYLVASAIQALSEAVAVGESAGLDPQQLVDLLTSTLFPGPVYSGYGSMIASRSYLPAGFTTTLGAKDVHLALDTASSLGIDLPLGEVLGDVFARALAAGHADQDWASVADLMPRRA